LRRATQDDDQVETIVVANQVPLDDLAQVEDRSQLVMVTSETNLGFGGGNDCAGRLAHGEYLVFLNDDSTVEPDFLEHLMATVESDPSIGAVGSRIALPDGTLQEAGSVIWNNGSTTHIGLGLRMDTNRFNYRRDADYVSANGFLIRRTAWDAVGGFDDRYHPAYFEDVDLCMSLREHGYRVLYEPRSLVHHLESQSTSTRYREFLLAHNRAQFFEKWRHQLERFGKPESSNPRAIEAGIQRARGNPGQLLFIAREFFLDDLQTDTSRLLTQMETLGAKGWAITLLLNEKWLEGLAYRRDRSGSRDRLVELGVELSSEAPSPFLERAAKDFDVIVLDEGQDSEDMYKSIRTRQPEAQVLSSAGDEALGDLSAIKATARSGGPSAQHATGPKGRVTMNEAPAELPGAIASANSRQAIPHLQRELDLANAELRVRAAYVQRLEADFSDLERRLASEPSVKIRGYVYKLLGPKLSRRLVRLSKRFRTSR
jgi:GT2 family glycosyltransferase